MHTDLYLYRIRPSRLAMLSEGPTPDEARIVGEHFAYLQRLMAEGRLHMAGRTDTTGPETMGLALFRADSPAQAQAVLDADPAVRQGVMVGEVFPFRIALWSGDPQADN